MLLCQSVYNYSEYRLTAAVILHKATRYTFQSHDTQRSGFYQIILSSFKLYYGNYDNQKLIASQAVISVLLNPESKCTEAFKLKGKTNTDGCIHLQLCTTSDHVEKYKPFFFM